MVGGDGGTHVFEALALVVLQQAVLAAEVALAEAAVSDDALRRGGALLEVAAVPLGRHCDGGVVVVWGFVGWYVGGRVRSSRQREYMSVGVEVRCWSLAWRWVGCEEGGRWVRLAAGPGRDGFMKRVTLEGEG